MQGCDDVHQHVTHSSSSKVNHSSADTIKIYASLRYKAWPANHKCCMSTQKVLSISLIKNVLTILLYFRRFLSWSEVSKLWLFPVHTDNTFSYSQPILRLSSYFPESRCAPHSWPFLCFPPLSLHWYMGLSKREIPMNPYERQVSVYIGATIPIQPAPNVQSQSQLFTYRKASVSEFISTCSLGFTKINGASFKYVRLYVWYSMC